MAALTKLVPVSHITYGTDYPYFGLGEFKALEEEDLSATELEHCDNGEQSRACAVPTVDCVRGWWAPRAFLSHSLTASMHWPEHQPHT